MWQSLVCISLGASVGACTRWGISTALSAAFPAFPLGTLVVNLVGAFGAGLATGAFMEFSVLSPALRLLLVTGFLGSLTTFSTFSTEVFLLFEARELLKAFFAIAANLLGSLFLVFLGVMSARFLGALINQ